ncbi:MAG: 1-deoxy-D-xylulose-5-phosphate synthase [Candidatus Omnitrophica bacterium]|nr:1-deoxy-D-xylulose-5-phosphate synthase [Candidatus Omnitrophota bacterium]MDD5351579.1 1-deoxy-D-xylulose-5-phosphate synthase [Candidatus Omnitrophota bacterium]MDD5551014.1 1-deoxy-D-xylulose-5-phosphate synthase [Candidatus Omnitrophota bacterium]
MLEKINNPADLKNIPLEKLPELAQEIRQRIISVISKSGGHLASSLGAVELAITLHYCLNTPGDKIIWDVGHQAYAHKILTGRNKDFDKIRQFGGISGFPCATESAYDPFTTGHSSTSVSLALGMVAARDLGHHTEKIVAVIGDGSLSGGMCFEALNNAGHIKADLIVILNTNEMSISPSVGALSNYVNKIISLPVYNRVKAAVENFMKLRIPRIGPRLAKLAERFEEILKGLIVPGIFFEELGFRYFGPFDGHNIELLVSNFKNITSLKGPILFHVVTTKGKGYEPAEKFPDRFHSTPKFDMQIKDYYWEVAETEESYTDVFSRHLAKLARDNPKIIGITAAMAQGTGLDLFASKYPERFFDVGIAEGHAVGFAGGLAKGGYRPFVAVYSTFLQRSFDQIIEEVCLQNLGVVFCIDRAGLVGQDGPTHHGIMDIVYLRNLPNMVVMAPSNKEELKLMLDFAASYNGPLAIRYPKHKAAQSEKTPSPIELGKSEIVAEGKDVVLLALGSMVETALEARELLLRENINAQVVNARFVKPLDELSIEQLANKYEFIFTLEEGNIEGGFGSAVLEYLERSSFKRWDSAKRKFFRLYNFGLPCQFITFGKREELLGLYGLLPEQIAKKITNLTKKGS